MTKKIRLHEADNGNSAADVVIVPDGTVGQVLTKVAAGAAWDDIPAIALASETVAGRVELATDAETQTGTDTARAITPANLSARTATLTRTGVVELATDAEAQAMSDSARALTPSNMAALMAVQTIATGGASKTLDPNVYAGILLTLTAAIELTITAPTVAGIHTLSIYTIQDSTGGWAITWPSSVDWDNGVAPTPSTAIGARTMYVLTTFDGGSHWTGSMVGTALS
jgi:hypothetical protein